MSITKLPRQIWRKCKRFLKPALHQSELRLDYDVLGTDYGGWPVVRGWLSPSSVVYSFGIGTDISFDLAVIERYRCRVAGFDPTPRSLTWLGQQSLPDLFHFYPQGLSDRATTLTFSAPPRDDFVSYTVAQGASRGGETISLPVYPLDHFMETIGDAKIDLLKMDIEGSEYDVIDDLVAKRIFPRQLCVEFHHDMYGYTSDQTRKAVDRLRSAGYQIYYVSDTGREYGMVQA